MAIHIVRRKVEPFDPHRTVTWEDHLAEIERQYETLVQLLPFHREKGLSHRNFAVGATALAYRPWVPGENISQYLLDRYRIFRGHNVKPGKHDRSMCAEQLAVNAARDAEYRYIIALAVLGEPQEDDHSHLLSRVLHCCLNCRRSLTGTGQMLNETRVIMCSLNPDVEPEEISWQELCELHDAAATVWQALHASESEWPPLVSS